MMKINSTRIGSLVSMLFTFAAILIVFGAILMVFASLGYAAESDVPDITMSVLESEDIGEDIIIEIQLPEAASAQAVEKSAGGLNVANEARDRGREFGQERAARAREQGGQGNRPDGVGGGPPPHAHGPPHPPGPP